MTIFRRRRSKATIARLTAENDALRHRLANPCNGEDCDNDGSAHCHACAETGENQLLAERDQIRSSYLAVVDYAVDVERERDALRLLAADLGRQLHGTQTAPCGDTVPLPRVRSQAVMPFPPKEWTT